MKYKSIKILYVESETESKDRLGSFISDFCGELFIVDCVEDALEVYKKHSIDIIISDFLLPSINTMEQCVIYIINDTNKEHLLAVFTLQADSYILKPVDLIRLKFNIIKCINCIESKQALVQLRDNSGFSRPSSVADITGITSVKERLHLLAKAMEQMDEMVRITDKEGYIVYVNESLCRETGYTKKELIGTRNSIFKAGKHTQDFYKTLWDSILLKEPFKAIFINKKKNGTLYYEDQVITQILDDNNEIKYFISTSKDISQRVKDEKKLKSLATIDTLTGICNRYKINQEIEDEIKRANRYGVSFALLMFDIDYFKKINDTYGHDIGDDVLKEFCSIISSSIRNTDKFGRWGGEEFLLLSPHTTEAVVLAEKLCLKIQEHVFKKVGRITVSIGISLYRKDEDKEKLLKRIDLALYKAKEEGRNQVVLY
ncbi:MAG TPA: diguanylate cyclase [Sulfurimonas sp.]|nr:diguanylate cyclase [Sulfurimonas sp.]